MVRGWLLFDAGGAVLDDFSDNLGDVDFHDGYYHCYRYDIPPKIELSQNTLFYNRWPLPLSRLGCVAHHQRQASIC